jgi:hypothetical protein
VTVHDYSLYGLSLRSEIPLTFPECRAAAAPDVTFTLATRESFADIRAVMSDADISAGWYRHRVLADGSVFVSVPDYCDFVISSDGRAVACCLEDSASVEWFQTYLLGIVLSFALLKLGHEPLHAAVVVVEGRGIAFLGDSGYGKSTLAASFVRDGYRILTDDLLIIREVDGVLCALPGPPRIKLFPEMARSVQPGKRFDEPADPDNEKVILPLERHEMHFAPVPLHAFFILDEPRDRTGRLSIVNLSPRESFVAILAATFNRRLRTHDRLHRQFAAAREWTARLPVRRICYPRTLAMLDDVRGAILAGVQR